MKKLLILICVLCIKAFALSDLEEISPTITGTWNNQSGTVYVDTPTVTMEAVNLGYFLLSGSTISYAVEAGTSTYSVTAGTASYAYNSDRLDGQHGSYYAIRTEVGVSTNAIQTDLDTAEARLVSVGADTGTIKAALDAEISATNTDFSSVGAATSTIQSDLDTAEARLVSVGADTGTIPSDMLAADNDWTGANDFVSTTTFSTITVSGYVGIGTDNPVQKLEVSPDADQSAIIGRAHIGMIGHGDYAAFAHLDQASATAYALRQANNGVTTLNTPTGGGLYFSINNSYKMALHSSGYFGIGTNAPETKFHLVGGSFTLSGTDSNLTVAGLITGSSVTVTNRLTVSGTLDLPAQSVAGADLVNDSVANTQLEYDTGQHLTTTSDAAFSTVTVTYIVISGDNVVDLAGDDLTVGTDGILDVDDSFVRNDADDDNSTFKLTMGSATVTNGLIVSGTFDPNGAITLPTTGISGAGAGSGLDADKWDGVDSTSTWKTADSELLDGEDSTHFVDTMTAQNIGGQKTFEDMVYISSKTKIVVTAGGAAEIGKDDCSATGGYAIAMTRASTASGASSVAMGHTSTASGPYSFAVGYSATASGIYSNAIGNATVAGGERSLAMGGYTKATAQYSTAIGKYLTNNTTNSFMVGYNASETTAADFSIIDGTCTLPLIDWTNSDRDLEDNLLTNVSSSPTNVDDVSTKGYCDYVLKKATTTYNSDLKKGTNTWTGGQDWQATSTMTVLHANTIRWPDGTIQISSPTGAGTPTEIKDADNDTKVQTEESADEDKIRFDTGGVERMVIDENGIITMPFQCCCRAYLSATQENLVDNTWTKILLNAENFDVNSDFDTGNNRFVAPVTGYYQVNVNMLFHPTGLVVDKVYDTAVYVNGANAIYKIDILSFAGGVHNAIADIVYCVAGQFIELYARSHSGDNAVDITGGTLNTCMSIALLQ